MNKTWAIVLVLLAFSTSSRGQTAYRSVAPVGFEFYPNLINPAYVPGNPKKTLSASLFQIGGSAASTTASVSVRHLLGWNAGYLRKNILGTTDKSNGVGSIELRGPLVNYNFNERLNVTAGLRSRFHANYWQADGRLISEIGEAEKVKQEYPYYIRAADMSMVAAAFSEIFICSSFDVLNTNTGKLRLGGSVKVINSLAQSVIEIGSLTGEIQKLNSYLTGITNATGTVSTYTSGDLLNHVTIPNLLKPRRITAALDLGMMYEFFRSSSKEKFLSVGVSVTDLGAVAFAADTAYSKEYDISIAPNEGLFFNNNFNNSNFSKTTEVFDKYPKLFDLKDVDTKRRKLHLPTTLHLNVRYQTSKRLAIQVDSDASLTRKKRISNLYSYTNFAITPIYQFERISVALPVAISEYTGPMMGFQFSNKLITVGSRNILGSLFYPGKMMDLFLGLRI